VLAPPLDRAEVFTAGKCKKGEEGRGAPHVHRLTQPQRTLPAAWRKPKGRKGDGGISPQNLECWAGEPVPMPSALSQALAATRCPPQSTNETDHPNERCGRLRARRLRSWSCDRRSCLEAPLEIPLVPILCLPCPIRSLMRRPTCAKSRGLPLCLLGHQALFPTVPQAEAISEVTFGFKRIARRSAQFSLQSSAFLFRGFPCVSTAAPPVSGSGPLLEFGDHRAHGRAAVFLGRRLRVVRGLRRPALPAPCLGDLLCHLGRARAALELGVCRVQRIPRVRVQGLEASIPQVGLKRSARAGTPAGQNRPSGARPVGAPPRGPASSGQLPGPETVAATTGVQPQAAHLASSSSLS